MNFKTYQSQLSQLSARFNLMVCLVFGLLISNVLLSCLIYKSWFNRTIEITPFFGSATYVKSTANVDSNYLSLMTENFINERLNVSPETVDANHKRLLAFVSPKYYPQVLRQLALEARVIRDKKISSAFNITQIKSNPSNLSSQVSGVLKRYVGLQPLNEEQLTYLLQFKYKDSRLAIIKFIVLKEKKDV